MSAKYPWVSIDLTQAPEKYAVYVQIAEGISATYVIEPNNLRWLEKEIKMTEDDPAKKLMETLIEVLTNVYWCPIDKKLVYPNYSDIHLPAEEYWCHCAFGTNHIKLNEFLKTATKEEIDAILESHQTTEKK